MTIILYTSPILTLLVELNNVKLFANSRTLLLLSVIYYITNLQVTGFNYLHKFPLR
jgi:hypothetical protein